MDRCRFMEAAGQRLGQEDRDLRISLDCRAGSCLRTKQSGLLLKSVEHFKACEDS